MATFHKAIGIAVASSIRLWLCFSEYQEKIASRVEISTPINSWKKVTEGVYLLNDGENPYYGDLIHEPPLNLYTYKYLIAVLSHYLPLLFILCDIVVAFLLSFVAKKYITLILENQVKIMKETTVHNDKNYDRKEELKIVKILFLTQEDVGTTSFYVFLAYLFNPYIILSCVAMTTTVFSNLFLAIFFYAMVNENLLLSCASLAVSTTQTMYPAILICPLVLKMDNHKMSIGKIVKVFLTFASITFSLIFASKHLNGNWSFLENVFGFILNVPDLRPNIGLFWYFFTEMFEHFRTLFISAFQINVMCLYLIPLTIRFRKDPVLLTSSLILLTAVFKSYPSLGDVGFCLSLLPMWTHLFKYLQQGFFVSCCFLVTSVLGPIVWQLWIYSRSANANFYFGVTLSFATAQIFLVTDLLFAYIKREFWISNRHLGYQRSKNATLILQ